ncbi:MAG: hypothetical protein APF76_16430 [Desulfitibacter sp. BRH_c19]|nr:MAG: hypothetical protein APF76_16430 [Desulfitibacter sp. BRH_c19]
MYDYKEVHKHSIVVDAHSDIPLDIYYSRNKGIDNIINQKHLPHLREGGVNIVFVNLYAELHPEGSLKQTLLQLGDIYKEIDECPYLTLIKTSEDLSKVITGDKIGLLLSMEGLEPISNDLSLLRVFYKLGLRSASLTWDFRNYFASGTGEIGGLSRLGKEAVQEMERLGVIVDVSHLNDEGFWDVIEVAKKPIIASHSNARSLYNHPRNLTDEQIDAIVKTGGVIGLNNYYSEDDDKGSLDTFMEHLVYIIDRAGEDHVGLGLDFNGYIGEIMTTGLEDARCFPNITKELLVRGYGIDVIEKVLGKNFLRVLSGVLR